MSVPGVIVDFLVAQGLCADAAAVAGEPLTGGVSSDIWRIDLPAQTLCVKRALPRLKVAALWEAPVSRNAVEWDWLVFAARHVPHAVPRPVAADHRHGLFAMQFLEPAAHPVWKQQLMDGRVDIATAIQVATILGKLHAVSAGDAQLATRFDTTDNFNALRLDPYLEASACRHPELAPALRALARRTATTRLALVHGDVSPKNVLVGPNSPVLLDAECAWYGDPAFDVAFCLNHLLLKTLVRPDALDACLASFEAFASTYLACVTWEPPAATEARAASLLPGLLLARLDGKSPVEYLPCEADKAPARRAVWPLILAQPVRLADVAAHWRACMRADG